MRKGDRDPPSSEDAALFRDAVRGATPLRAPARAQHRPAVPPPLPVQSLLDSHDALAESIAGEIPWDQSPDTGEEPTWLRRGLGRDVLKKLRRGHWAVQGELDLHGLNREQARQSLAGFLARCEKRGARCVRVVHGKGLRSPGREPVLKGKVRQWLARRDEVLAYCEAPLAQGGSGALLVLLKA